VGIFCRSLPGFCDRLAIFLLVTGLSATAIAQTSSRGPGKGPAPGHGYGRATFPMPQKARVPKGAPAKIAVPGNSIPTSPEKYVWRVTNASRGSTISTGGVPVVGSDGGLVGSLPSGSEVKIEYVRTSGQKLFYGIPWRGDGPAASFAEDKASAPVKMVWIDGNFIENAGRR